MTVQAMKVADNLPDPRDLSKAAQESCRLALEYAAAKTSMSVDAVKKSLEQGEEICGEYFLYAWAKAIAPRIADLCPEVSSAYLLAADGVDGDSYLRDLVIVTERGSEAFALLCEGLGTEFDRIRRAVGLTFSIAVHGIERSEVARGERVAAALKSTSAPALQLWSSQPDK